LTKANLRDPSNFLSAVGEEFGDVLYKNKGQGLRNLSNTIKGSQADSEVHALSMVSCFILTYLSVQKLELDFNIFTLLIGFQWILLRCIS
jgi:hypothetical protein